MILRLLIYLFCRGGQIRTDDLLLPKQTRYRATLHPEVLFGSAKVRIIFSNSNFALKTLKKVFAEREGFEPSVPL